MRLYHRRGWRAVAYGLCIAVAGATMAFALQRGLWGMLTGATLAAIWLTALAWWNAVRVPPRPNQRNDEAENDAVMTHRLLLDAAPTPLLAIDDDTAHVLNRAARSVFGTDDRVLPALPALLDPAAVYLHHEGRQWRIDRVAAPGSRTIVAALIDVEREKSAAEARASAEFIEVLGHELLNGLAPIVSLAESATDAVKARPVDVALLEEILGPLARRAEGLQRFASAYREMARLPEPIPKRVPLKQFAQDCARAFAQRWPGVALRLDSTDEEAWPMDRDQIQQAVWALLNNAAEAACEAADPKVALTWREEHDHLAIDISDNGPGIAPERARQIFRPFHTTKPDGSGIGLSLARQIARGHGGTIELVGSSPTTFRLSLLRPVISGRPHDSAEPDQ